jgi:hypothetical protein
MSTKTKAKRALASYFGDRPGILDDDLRVEDTAAIVLPTVGDPEFDVALDDLDIGMGGERAWIGLRRPKLHSAYSSCGLVLNTFAPWRIEPSSLTILGRTGWEGLQFERQLPIFRGGRAPNLDAVATAPGYVLAIESKLTEHLSRRSRPQFSDAYDRLEAATDPSWWAMYRDVKRGARQFSYLDTAQLTKHYFGLKKHCEKHHIDHAALLYLYWEPENGDQYKKICDHAAEVADFRESVTDPVVQFEAMTYSDLWASWDGLTEPSWLHPHLVELRRRYAVPLD